MPNSLLHACILVGAGVFLFILRKVLFWIGFYRSSYHRITGSSWNSVKKDPGKYGEYLIACSLKKYEKKGARILYNIYLPKKQKGTTEVDLAMIWRSGIYVFESKNYSGWIFGNEWSKYWIQTLPKGSEIERQRFFNPVIQNDLHIRCMKHVLSGYYVPIHSIIVFADRCTLKRIRIQRKEINIIKCKKTARTIRRIDRQQGKSLTEQEIDQIYHLLYPYTQVTSSEKKRHIRQIRRRHWWYFLWHH